MKKVLKKKTKREKKKGEPCFFPERLYKVLKKRKNNNIITWNEDGTIVIIKDPIEFSNNILSKEFKTINYTSFVRQLNIYGFHKINNIYNSTEEKFMNDIFKRDMSISEIREIKRKDFTYLDDKEDNNLTEKKLKEQSLIIDKINKINDEEKKIEEYKKLVNEGNINSKFTKNILEFIIKMNDKRINFYEKTQKKIKDLIANNEITLKNLEFLWTNNYLIQNNKNKSNNTQKIPEKICYSSVRTDSFILNENEKLLMAFKDSNEKENKIEKSNDDKNNKLNASFCEDLSILVEKQKNNIPSQLRSSYILLNKSGILMEPTFPNNNTVLKNNMTNSFL